MIKLIITKEVPNEQFEKQIEDYNRNNRGGYHNNGYEMPRETKTANMLDVFLTEEQWEAIKKEVIKVF